ncbi:MAG: hypothetical protein AAGF53_09970 [Pseudomonadota bacterium]
MKRNNIVMLVAAIGLAACGSPDPEAQKEKHLKPNTEAVSVEFNDKSAAEKIVGFRAVPVGLVDEGSDPFSSGSEPENLAAECSIVSQGYSARVTAPATVNMPSFGRDTPPATVSCEYQGKTYSETFKARNLSKGSRTGSSLAVGILLCPICGVAAGIAGSGDKVGDAYGFEDLTVSVN